MCWIEGSDQKHQICTQVFSLTFDFFKRGCTLGEGLKPGPVSALIHLSDLLGPHEMKADGRATVLEGLIRDGHEAIEPRVDLIAWKLV